MMFKSSSVVAAAAILLTSILPVQAAPLTLVDRAPISAPSTNNNLLNDVQYRRDDWRGPPPGYRRPPPPPRGWRAGPPPRRDGYYNGHRGYRDRRPGYRQHNGLWFPLAAFATGAIIGGAINNNQAAPAYGGSHHEWCANRWRSYRASDNSYQPNNGPRRECVSPYMR